MRDIGPELYGYERSDRWMALVYRHIDGRHCDLRPGSPDIPRVVAVIEAIGCVELPDAKAWPRRAWKGLATPEEVALIHGDRLLHSDPNPDNVLITGGSRAWVVDWASPTRGAAIVNLAELVTQLIAAGHTPDAAERVLSECAAWAQADPATLDTLARVHLRMHRTWETDRPGWAMRFPAGTWLRAITPAVEHWAAHRGVTA